VNRTAALLISLGVQKGDVVSLLMPNSAEYIIAYFACWKLGALAGPVNSLLKPHELIYVISNSDAKVLLVHSDFSKVVEEIRAQLPALRAVVTFDDEVRATRDLSPEVELPKVNITTEDEAIIIYTSGTTGKPKGCLLTHGNVNANARQITDWLKFSAADRLLTIMPLFHMNAVSVTTTPAVRP
jgi:acyl-CoA synthetase (AMP-forming)/AMP-acid ligase II